MKFKSFLPLTIGIAIAIGILIGSFFNFENKSVLFTSNKNEAKIKRLINYIQYDYVDEVDTDSLLDNAITNMLVKLDPHSVYIPKENRQAVTENFNGKFVGIGVSFLMYQDSVTVTGIIEGGPSEKVGLKAGDRIIAANGDLLFGEHIREKAKSLAEENNTRIGNRNINEAVLKWLKGPPNTKVTVTVYRRSTDEVIDFDITRGDVPLKSVTAHYMLNDKLGYIKIERFARSTYKEFFKSLTELMKEGMESLALDLRGNPGGFMHISDAIIDEFLEDGKLIVYTKNKNGEVEKHFASKVGVFEHGKVYVLIDQNSASASEIVAGALQDNDKGTIIGRRSFGKGLVQQEMDLGDGSAVRLTTSRYYTPTGRSIQKPYETKTKSQYNNVFAHRYRNGELTSKDSIKVVDSLKFTTPKGKTVYGGGGIVPDVFVSIDTTSTFGQNYHVYQGLNNFVFRYIDAHRQEMEKWELKDFVKNFDKNDEILNQYIAEQDLNMPLSAKAKEDLELYFNAIMARDLFDLTGFYMIRHKRDNVIQKVLEIDSAN
jgi:carboxyl-terminal processing protease